MNDHNTPSEPQHAASPQTVEPMHGHTQRRRGNFFAVLLILIGVVALINQLFPHEWIRWNIFWPVVIILLGVRMMTRKR